MGAVVSVQVEGMDKLVAALNEVPYARARKLLLKVLVAGAKPIREAIRAEAPVGPGKSTGKYAHPPGALKRGVKFKASRTSKTGQIAYMIGPFGKGTAQRHLIVSGHAIKGHKHNLLGASVGHKKVGGLMRTRPNPFIERGEAAAREAALAAIESTARSAFEELTHA